MKTQIFHKIKNDLIEDHIRPLLCYNHVGTFINEPILIKICMNVNLMKTQICHKMRYDLKGNFLFM